jgi:peptidoglycan/LPS O-acetylase OafA/YrhL
MEIAFTIAAQVVVALILNHYKDFIHAIPMKISDDLIRYLAFICPLYRVGDFYVGCLIGYLFKNKVFSHILDNVVISTFLEIIALVAAPLLLKVCQKQIGLLGTESFRETLIYLGEEMILVYTVAYSRGLISRWIFSSKLMVAIGNISGYAFLIHWPVLSILRKGLNISNEMFIIRHVGGLVITLVVSFAVSYIVKLNRGSRNEWRFGRKK